MSTASSLTQHGKDLRYCPNTGARVVTLADFEVGQQLGKGITGSVFVARDRRTNAVVALKRLNIAEIARQNMGVQIERELAIIQKLDHPNILKMFTYFTDKEHLYLVIEYAVRGDLWQRLLQQGSFSLEMTAMLVSQLADAVHYAHQHNVIHRDIKPENLLLDANKNLKLADFGWSVLDKKPRNTFCGTPDYIPPEMVANVHYDNRIDNWCIGVFAYECLFGKPPFAAEEDSTRNKKILALDYAFPATPVMPDEAYDLIKNLLRVDPRKRLTLEQLQEHPFIVKYYRKKKAAKQATSADRLG
ncbi:Serine/threonine-protein kinase Aurora-3 [Diplonema papillatum]|nr:Serine/threonine-protein kinase Aurora-3 [Diplonema papillatum]KAJ9442956.1 Serine/threonine-protein kinase Aurora-3 [Diplonema papillatum]